MKKLLIILTLMSGAQAIAQQDAMYTHYSFNTLGVNPGYAGSRDALTMVGLHRSQWLNFDGAPMTQTFTLHTPLMDNKLGLGASFNHDRIGPTTNTGIFVDFAYKLKIGKGSLAFGLKGGLAVRGNRLDELTQFTDGDPTFELATTSDLLPNFGFGLYYSNPKFYVGISAPRLLENNFSNNVVSGGTNLLAEARHYYLIAGAMLNLNEKGSLKLKPTTFLKLTGGATPQLDLTALLYIKDIVWVGPMWRTSDAVGILAGVNITRQLGFGYSFDFSYANTTGRYNNGSHEIMLRYDFIYKHKLGIVSPRHF